MLNRHEPRRSANREDERENDRGSRNRESSRGRDDPYRQLFSERYITRLVMLTIIRINIHDFEEAYEFFKAHAQAV